jgi:tripartite-type tricarboxylate transporter receptor subunit TctC
MKRHWPVCVVVFSCATAVTAQPYPSKPIRVIVPWPGGSNDAAARLVFQKIAEAWGQQAVIDNRTGASGTIGAALVARSPGDGYTVMVTSASIATNQHLYKSLPYHVLKDLTGITPLATQIGVLTVHPSLPVHSVKELIAFARGKPDQLLYGSSGAGSFLHLTMAHFNVMSNTRMVHVPYKGGDAAGISLVAGETQVLMASTAVVMPLLPGNRLRVLGVTSENRIPQLPNAPTIAEAGVPGYEYTAWVGAFAPSGTPRPIIDKLHGEMKRALDHPDVKTRFDNIGLNSMFMTPEQFAARIKADYDKAARLIAVSGVKVN